MLGLWSVIVLVGLISYYLWTRDDNPKAPPGPTPWPILGNLVHIARASDDVTLTFSELSKKYGEIFSLKMGMKSNVVITSREAIEAVLSHENSFARDASGTFGDRVFHKNLGIAFSNGDVWEKTRSWTLKNLKEFGFGKSSEMEHYVQDAAEALFADIDEASSKNGIVNVEMLFSPHILKVIWEIMIGKVSEEDEKMLKILCERSERWIRCSTFGAGILNAFPFLRFIFPEMMGYNIQMLFYNTCNDISKKLFEESQARLEQEKRMNNPHSFLEAFVQNACNGTDPTVFHLQNFQLVFQDILTASTETNSSFMEFAVLFLIQNPETQDKIYQEIQEVVPHGGFLDFADKNKMVYTQAFILECHRNGNVLQNFVPRQAIGDICYKDYVIKKGTIIIADSYLYNTDDKQWGDANKFRPERFIDEKGELCNASDIISFSVGKRNCPGELYANVVAFLFLTSLVQRYKISVPPGHPLPRSGRRNGIIYKPYPFKASFTKRPQ